MQVPLGEKIRDVPLLRARGNKHYQAGDYRTAAICYSTALSYIERMAAESANITTMDQCVHCLGHNGSMCHRAECACGAN
jgi:hypothetical protein